MTTITGVLHHIQGKMILSIDVGLIIIQVTTIRGGLVEDDI